MADFDAIGAEMAIAVLREKCGAIGDAFNRCFNLRVAVQVGNSQLLDAGAPPRHLDQPGVLVSLTLGSQTMLCAIPENLLPAGYSRRDAAQQTRLDALAMDWSLNCLPDDFPAELFQAEIVPDLWSSILNADPEADVTLLELIVISEDGEFDLPSIWLVWPVIAVSVEPPAAAAAPPFSAGFASEPRVDFPPARPLESTASRLQRLLNVPVPIIVKLAEKKIELGQLLAIGPGAIVSFEKSCEDLLDLYVNNRLFCRGEAVKIGEKFGIKINEVGTVEERISAVFNPR